MHRGKPIIHFEWSAFVTAALILLGAVAGAAAATDPSEAEITQEFQTLCRSTERSLDLYWGKIPQEKLASDLKREESRDKPDALSAAILRLKLAKEFIEFGRIEDALVTLDEQYFAAFDGKRRAPRGGLGPPSEPTILSKQPDAEVPVLASASSSPSDVDIAGEVHAAWLMLRLEALVKEAENQNCFINHTATSCILPFDEGGIHAKADPARRAGEVALAILADDPSNSVARWVLNLMRMASRDYPEGVPIADRLPENVLRSSSQTKTWKNRALALGLTTFDLAGGAIMDDFDGDGLLDLMTSTADPCDHFRAYRNDGKGGFEDVTERWGLSNQLGGLNVVHADYDGDGALDLLILRGAWRHELGQVRNSLLHNQLAGPARRFVDVTASSGLDGHDYPTQTAAFADYDLDGDLDLYIGNEAYGPRRFPSQLFRNNGRGRFVDVTEKAGVSNMRMAKGVAWGDFDNDGDPDLYVSNIGPNRLYRNDGDGSFTDVAPQMAVVDPFRRSFATWFFDYDNDGRLDLFVSDYDAEVRDVAASYFGERRRSGHPLLYRNDGKIFQKVSKAVGLTRPLMPMGANYGDVNNDGWLDLYLGTGEPSYLALVPNVLFQNEQGVHFFDVTFSSGVGHLQKGHGVAFGDLDNDGDQDLFHQLGGFYPGDGFSNALFENPGNEKAWITLRLVGRGANRFGVGARIEVRIVEARGSRSIHLLAGSGGSFGGSSMQQEIGLGDAERIEEIRIRWPGNDRIQSFRDVSPNRFYRAVEGQAELLEEERARIQLGSPKHPPRGHEH
jgi:hypothetical protein